MTTTRISFALRIVSLAAFALTAASASAADWPSWRGPEQNGYTRENAPVTDWSPEGKNVLWKSSEGGRSTPIVMNGRVFFVGPVGDGTCLQERVICLDADSGKTLWEYRFNVFFTEIAANRVGWTSVVGDSETGNIYTHTTGGDVIALSREGKLVWKRSMMQEFNRVSGYGGRLMNPIVDENRVVISFLNTNWANQAKPCHRYLALDKKTGQVIWWAEPGGTPADTTYAIPYATVIDGKRIMVAPNADGKVYGMLARTGQVVWSSALSKVGLNVSPVGDGKNIYFGQSEENLDTTLMGRLVCIDGSKTGDITKSGEFWRLDGLDAGYASPALGNGRIYCVDNSAMLHCVDAKTGKKAWDFKLGRVGKGSPVLTADGVIYVGEQNGVFWILKDGGDKCVALSKVAFAGPDNTIDEIFGSPAVCGGRVYFMTRYATYCLGSKGAKTPNVSIPAMAAESGTGGEAVKTIQVVPGELAVAPGETVKFTIHGFTGNGAAVPDAGAANWNLSPGFKGAIGKDGTFTAPSDAAYSAGLVTAKVGELTATARVRVSPKLPIKEDFEKMTPDAPPPGWVGVMGKTKIVDRDGSKCFKKMAEKGKPSPVWKMRAFSNPPIAGGYTIEADMLGTLAKKRFKPDMGLINSGYEMVLMGMTKELELSRWRDEPTHALRHKVPMELKPDQWYRMKFQVVMKDGKAHVGGKVWPRGETEPTSWTIEFEDACPNTESSPGIFTYSNGTTDKSDGAEVYVDNYMVYGNE